MDFLRDLATGSENCEAGPGANPVSRFVSAAVGDSKPGAMLAQAGLGASSSAAAGPMGAATEADVMRARAEYEAFLVRTRGLFRATHRRV